MAWTTPKTWTELETLTSSDMNLQVKGNIEYLKGRPIAAVTDLDGAVGNTTSTTFVDVTGASVSITTAGSSRLLVIASWEWGINTSPAIAYMTVTIDGVNQGHSTYGITWDGVVANSHEPASLVFLTTAAVSNAAHTVKLQYRTNVNTVTIYGFSLVVAEVY